MANATEIKLNHTALYVHDLEGARDFFAEFFGTVSNELYHNRATGLRTYFLTFHNGGKIEIMTRPGLDAGSSSPCAHGLNHIAVGSRSKGMVESLTERMRKAGYTIISGPRTTGDGYYESCVESFEGCLIEIAEMQRAFIFCLFTGLRWCDVKLLTYANVDPMTKTLRFQQKKVRNVSSRSWVTTPLTDDMLALVGEPITNDRSTELVFKIGPYVNCNLQLKKWVAEAGIRKNISWHCSRHSFAVNLLSNGANIKTVADLMGHSSITMTEKYLHVVDSLKQDAIHSLGSISYAMP